MSRKHHASFHVGAVGGGAGVQHGLTTAGLAYLSDVETSVIKSRASLITPLASRRYPDWPITNTPCISRSPNAANAANAVTLIPRN
jgi:hypothetical protein